MFQDTPDFFFYQNESTPSQRGIHSTPNSQGTESETSFDSGYLSPATSQNTPGSYGYYPLTNNSQLLNKYNASLLPPSNYVPNQAKASFDDDWDKKFIENFEANLFGIDPTEDFSNEDINLFSELLASPLKTGLSPVRLYDTKNSPAKYSRSPLKSFFSPPKSRRSLLGVGSSGLSDYNTATAVPNNNEQITLSSLSDSNFNLSEPQATASSFILDQSLLTHNYAKRKPSSSLTLNEVQRQSHPESRVSVLSEVQSVPVTKLDLVRLENCASPELLPSKQKLQYVRAKFKQTLEKAVENAKNAAVNEEKYPQLTKRLSKSNSASQDTKSKENLPTSSEDEGHHDKRRSSSLSAAADASIGQAPSGSQKQKFRELAPAPSQKRTFACIVNNQFEVQQPSPCQIVIKKRKTY